MRNIDEHNITAAVVARHAEAKDPRLAQVMTALVEHLHAFARDVKLTEAEWFAGIEFLTACGRMCSDKRQEFILLSDVLGLSMLVTAQNNAKPAGCTEATVFGPFHIEGAPHFEDGGDVGQGAKGEPCYMRGHVLDLQGRGIAGAEIDVWQADAAGFYDVQYPDLDHPQARGALTSRDDGSFHFKSIVAEAYPIPHDGPVGAMLAASGRHPWRPAHLHFMITAPGYERLITHVFRAGGKYLDSDVVFGVRSSLIAEWVRHDPGVAPDGSRSAVPYYTLDFDFVLAASPAAK